jgi:thymidylate synthase (FAD)
MNVELLGVFGDDLMVVNAARVSLSKHHDSFDQGSDARLIKYLDKEGHWTPFSHPKVQLRITLPIFVARQWEKHRVGAIRGYDIYDQSEVSRRYVDADPEFFSPSSWRSRPEGSIKQGSGDSLEPHIQYKVEQTYANAIKVAEQAYKAMLSWGVAPEQARMVLPQSMYTSWIETGSLAYWARVYKLRAEAHAQQEIQTLARQVKGHIAPRFPESWSALENSQ